MGTVIDTQPRRAIRSSCRRSERPTPVRVFRDSGGRRRDQPCSLPSVSGLDLEDELVLADADPVAVGERDTASDSTVLYVNAVGGAQIGNDEGSARVADHGVVAADFGVVEHDVIVRKPANASGRPDQGIGLSKQRTKTRHGGPPGRRGPPIEGARGGRGGGECGSTNVHHLLT